MLLTSHSLSNDEQQLTKKKYTANGKWQGGEIEEVAKNNIQSHNAC